MSSKIDLSRVVLASGLLFLMPSLLVAQSLRVGSVVNQRFETAYTLDGSQFQNTRAKLTSPGNFGPDGTAMRTIEITDTAGEVGSLTFALLLDFDVFFVGWLDDGHPNAFTGDELDALYDFVSAGGVLIATCDDTNHDDVCNYFGHPITAGLTLPGRPQDPDHPIMNGPFGVVAEFQASGNVGNFANIEDVQVVAVDSAEPARAVIIVGELGAGKFIFIGDVNIVSTTGTAGPGIVNQNDRLIANLFAYVGDASSAVLYFAHVGDGQGVVSEVVLANTSSSVTAEGTLEFFGDQAELLLEGFEERTFSIPPMGTVTLPTLGESASLASGAVRVVSNTHHLGGVVRFSIPGVGIAGVGSSIPRSRFLIPVRRVAGGIDTGVALHNADSSERQVSLTLRDESGAVVEDGQTMLELGPGGQVARFISDLFAAAQTDNFRGSLTVEAEGGRITGVALEFAPSAGQFTTLPVIPF